MGNKIVERANETIKLEAESIQGLSKFIDDDFQITIEKLATCQGRLVVTGIGKSANIAKKIVATFNSTGTPSLFMHAADAIHGDLGMVQKDDMVICISKSGNSPEIKVLVPLVKNMGNALVAMTADVHSFLASNADYKLITYVEKEACPNNLAPTTSTTAQLVMGDIIAVCLMEIKGFGVSDFAKFHPGGALGKKIYTKVSDLMLNEEKAWVEEDDTIKEVIISISKGRAGATAVIANDQLIGIITDGDLRRAIETKTDLLSTRANEIMSKTPKTVQSSDLAVNAFNLMEKNKINQLVVLEGERYIGMLHIHDLLKEGIY